MTCFCVQWHVKTVLTHSLELRDTLPAIDMLLLVKKSKLLDGKASINANFLSNLPYFLLPVQNMMLLSQLLTSLSFIIGENSSYETQ